MTTSRDFGECENEIIVLGQEIAFLLSFIKIYY